MNHVITSTVVRFYLSMWDVSIICSMKLFFMSHQIIALLNLFRYCNAIKTIWMVSFKPTQQYLY